MASVHATMQRQPISHLNIYVVETNITFWYDMIRYDTIYLYRETEILVASLGGSLKKYIFSRTSKNNSSRQHQSHACTEQVHPGTQHIEIWECHKAPSVISEYQISHETLGGKISLLPWVAQAHSEDGDACLFELGGGELHGPLGASVRQEDEDAGDCVVAAGGETLPQDVLHSQACLGAASPTDRRADERNWIFWN